MTNHEQEMNTFPYNKMVTEINIIVYLFNISSTYARFNIGYARFHIQK